MVAIQHASPQAVNEEIAALLSRRGLCRPGETPPGEALAGGVSSDIWRVDLASGAVCVKRALPRLRVAQLWEAPVSRNRYEYEWLRIAGEVCPGAAPRVLFREEDAFAMEYLDPAVHPVWKNLLRQGRADPAFAAQVGRTLAAIHAATAGSDDIAGRFPTDEIFHAIRLEPYLVAASRAHRDLAERLDAIVKVTANTRACLVHGDVSPKNILCGPRGPVFLDAECAWYGDPAFDLAFCLNHLLLKCLWVPQARPSFLECFDALGQSYLAGVRFPSVEARAAALLPALLLARVDGKSPVEYLTEPFQKDAVRRVARPLIASPVDKLEDVRRAWQESLT
jgi:aminoglycoside phosphotransferase (APT) family kinase protein